MLRRILLASAGAIALSGAAFAADLPVRAPPPVYLPPPPPMWTGFYAGLNAGGIWSASNNVSLVSTGALGAGLTPLGVAVANAFVNGANDRLGVGTSGFIGGGQVGYNFQWGPSWLVGLEADIQGTTASANRNVARAFAAPGGTILTTSLSSSRSLDYFGTVRGRIGFLVTPTLLIYGTGGLAYGGINANIFVAQTLVPGLGITGFPAAGGSFSNTRVGWTAGGGLEWLFTPNWSVKVEYLYFDLGSVQRTFGPLAVTVGAAPLVTAFPALRANFNGNIVRAGINYHFNWGVPAPVVAKY